jgi:hypothetical protein
MIERLLKHQIKRNGCLLSYTTAAAIIILIIILVYYTYYTYIL